MSTPRRVLILQAPPSGFARDLAAALQGKGFGCLKVNFSLGDWLFWHGPGTIGYRGGLPEWEGALRRLIADHAITDLLYFADCTPCHRIARRVGEDLGLRVTAFEYGYLRPDWIVAEPGGQSAFSCLTRDPDRLKAAARDLPLPDLARLYPPFGAAEARGDVIYHLANYVGAPLYPGFRRDRRFNPVIEYLSYLPRRLRGRRAAAAAPGQLHCLRAGQGFFLCLMQMENDYQIRMNAPFAGQADYLEEVLTSFAAHAPGGTQLAVRLHPQDNGLIGWGRLLRRLSRRLGLEERVHLVDGGPLEPWLEAARGVVTVNSTAGLAALLAGRPTICRGVAIYDLPGLCHQGPLEDFWRASAPPDPELLEALVKVLAAHVHVRGDFYGAQARRDGAEALARRLAAPVPAVFDPAPPAADSLPKGVSRPRRLPDLGRVAVSGASGAIGGALARALAEPGRTLVLGGRRASVLEALAQDCRARGARVQVVPQDLAQPGPDWPPGPPPDLLICAAGCFAGRHHRDRAEPEAALRDMIAVNLSGTLALAGRVAQAMRARGRGQILLLGSLAALGPLPDAPGYSASKAGIAAFARALRADLAGSGVRVVLVQPGHVASAQTACHRGPLPFLMTPEAAAERILKGLEAGRPRIDFPRRALWLLRLAALLPWRLRVRAERGQAFTVAEEGTEP
ncbi:SDR family NAD(P)-dependent oxidoreductase [Pseudooceanicola sp. CBS1P-1]|uniref:SDR family NAD(P)-dependent oxidoreductase n=1 Tax=Pseudooceanicola albus TaxID=2692189 RepID=A0A6L7G8H6_9RHOB|nr:MULTISPECIES: SDR family NAD(P)-dependent oxidoreductase [Pseudooceanicola]MBT9386511.1 SDR family NAD(P)-dependent oxidoreductase [Pseudooceanicola endophyticus]MXN20544.1 SDR family NAD(P)-dependent oxidoreductase [Pseudooceanicola albus]